MPYGDRAFSNLERVRVGELKREIAKGAKLKSRIEIAVPGDEQASRTEYVHGQTVLNSPIYWRPDGSVVWLTFNAQLEQSEGLDAIRLSTCY